MGGIACCGSSRDDRKQKDGGGALIDNSLIKSSASYKRMQSIRSN